MSRRKYIRWGRIPKNPEADLCGITPEGLWDVVHSSQGWVIYAPKRNHERDRYVHDGNRWVKGMAYQRLSLGITREDAQREAERLYLC